MEEYFVQRDGKDYVYEIGRNRVYADNIDTALRFDDVNLAISCCKLCESQSSGKTFRVVKRETSLTVIDNLNPQD